MKKDSMYAIDRSDEYLAHYGVLGMRWGVRKAIAGGGVGKGNRRLAKHYAKAEKKLNKLKAEAKMADANAAKRARRAAGLAAGAAALGGLAAAGTTGVANAVRAGGNVATKGLSGLGNVTYRLGNVMTKAGIRGNTKVLAAGKAMQKASTGLAVGATRGAGAIQRFGNSTNNGIVFDNAKSIAIRNRADKLGRLANAEAAAGKPQLAINNTARAVKLTNTADAAKTRFTNNQLLRAGAAAAGLGLAGAAGYNAYKAARAKSAAKRAAKFESEMNQAFKGTAYDKRRSSGSKNRRRRG